MQTFETAAVISLIDHLSGPLAKLATHVGSSGTRFDRHAEHMVAVGKKMSYAYTLPALAIGKHLMDHAVEFDKVENTLQGVLMTRHRTMKDLTQSHEEYARTQRKLIDQASELAYKNTGGMVNALEYRKSTMAGIKAGFDTDSATAIANTAFNLSRAGRIDEHEAADQLITLANSFHLKLKDQGGKALPSDQLNKAFGSMADLLTTMSTNANMTEQEAFESLKLAAPMAHHLKLSPFALGAIQETAAEAGFKGSEAGVAMRAFEMATLAPKSTAIPMLKHAGIDINKYREFKPDYDMGPEAFMKYVRGKNYDVNQGDVARAYAQAHALADASHGDLTFQGALADTLSPIIRSKGKKHLPIGSDIAQKAVMNFVSQGAESVDMMGLLMDMRSKNLTVGQLRQFGEGRQIPRWMQLLTSPKPGENDVFGNSMKRAFGDDWEEQVKKMYAAGKRGAEVYAELVKVHDAAAIQAKEHAQSLEGSYLRIGSAYNHLTERLYKAGVFDAAASGLNHLADMVDKFAAQSPGMQKFEIGAVALVAGLGPLLLLSGRMLQAGKAFMTLSGLLATAGAGTAAAGTAGAAGAGATATGATGAGLTGAAAAAARKAAGLALAASASMAYGEQSGETAMSKAIRDFEKLPEEEQKRRNEEYRSTHKMTPFMQRFHRDMTTLPEVYVDPRFQIPVPQGEGKFKTYGPAEIPPEDKRHPQLKGDAPSRLIGGEGSHSLIEVGKPNPDSGPVRAYHAIVEGFQAFRRSFGNEHDPRFNAGALPSTPQNITVAPSSVEGTVKGEATLVQSVKVDPSPYFLATVQNAQQTVQMGLSGKLGQTMKGANASVASVAPGLSAFKPTMSGR